MSLVIHLRYFLLLSALSMNVQASPLRAADCNDSAVRTLSRAVTPAADARAHWLDLRRMRWSAEASDGQFKLYVSAVGALNLKRGNKASGADAVLALNTVDSSLPEKFKWLTASGVTLELKPTDAATLDAGFNGQVLLVRENAQGLVEDFTALQQPGYLDARYAAAAQIADFGVTLSDQSVQLKLWAPTARTVAACVFAESSEAQLQALQLDPSSGAWKAELKPSHADDYYVYLLDVFVPSVGWMRHRVTDPYALSLNANAERSLIADLDAPALKPAGWDRHPRPAALETATDLSIYELHVRDFSISDLSVKPALRGKYLAFTQARSNGMRHLRALAQAGISDVHLLPVFDFASVPELGCAAQAADTQKDCFNWGYDPAHFGAPEGSYASDAADGRVRIVEFRAMVQALHAAGLRVGMDVVYNHTAAAGIDPRAVLDRIVPGYYHRLDVNGKIERSTCCENTATEHLMMEKLMVDTAVRWVRDYQIDSFRFDLMGHQPRAAMERLQLAIDRAAARHIDLLGEGWNFGEIANNARFVQASQLEMRASSIATFSDRARDALRGGGCCDSGADLLSKKGLLTGASDDLRLANLARVGLAGSLQTFALKDASGARVKLKDLDYAGQMAGYASAPGEVVNYVENHDNPTLFDIGVLKLPTSTSADERARVQLLGAAFVAFSQGIAYHHAGFELLRSKSLEGNSFDAGDAPNRLDWTFTDNNFRPKPGALIQPTMPVAGAQQIRFMRDGFLELLRIRASTRLLRLSNSADVLKRLTLPPTGARVVVGVLDGRGLVGERFERLIYLINVDTAAHPVTLASERSRAYQLHPVQRKPAAIDTRLRAARYDRQLGRFFVPARTAVVYVVERGSP